MPRKSRVKPPSPFKGFNSSPEVIRLVVALWPVGVLPVIEAILAAPGRHAVRDLAAACSARAIVLPGASRNINTPADLAALGRLLGD